MGNIGKPKISKLIDFEESEKESVSIEMGNSENVLGDYSENELVIVKMVSVEIEKSKPKLHICEHCGTAFDRKSNLKRHLRVHQLHVVNVICSVCQKTFSNASNLKVHLEAIHGISENSISSKIVKERNRGLPFQTIDKSTQTEELCSCSISATYAQMAQLEGYKWKDTLMVRHWLNPPRSQ